VSLAHQKAHALPQLCFKRDVIDPKVNTWFRA